MQVITSLGHFFQSQGARLEASRREAEMVSRMVKGLQQDTGIDDLRLMRFKAEASLKMLFRFLYIMHGFVYTTVLCQYRPYQYC